MAVTGNWLKLKTELAQLAARHGLTAVPHSLALAAPTQCSMVLRGFASTGDLDFDRCRFAPFSYGMVSKSRTQLLYAHDPKQIAGQVLKLGYDPYGSLLIEARVDH